MSTLLFSSNAVAPIILVILLGYIIQKTDMVPESFFVYANKLVFNVAIPVYLFYSVYNIENLSDINWSLILAAVIMAVVICLLAVVFFVFYTKDSGKRGVLIQCAYRSNYAIIGIPLAKAMGGEPALATAAVVSAFGIPTFNILAVIVLSVFSYNNDNKKISVKGILKSICKNPLIIGVCCALVCLAVRSYVPFTIKENMPFLYEAIKDVGGMASPLALIVLGGRFKISAVRELAGDIVSGVVWRLILAPVISLAVLMLLSNYGIISLEKTDLPAFIAFYGSPVAVSSAIMAESMNCHGELARQLVIWCNVISIFTVFAIIAVCKYFSLI